MSKFVNRDQAVRLGGKMESLIWEMIDDLMFFKELEEFDQVTIEDFIEHDDGKDLNLYDFQRDGLRLDGRSLSKEDKTKIAYRFRRIKHLYQGTSSFGCLLIEAGHVDYHRILSHEFVKDMERNYLDIDRFTQGWLTIGKVPWVFAVDHKQVRAKHGRGRVSLAKRAKTVQLEGHQHNRDFWSHCSNDRQDDDLPPERAGADPERLQLALGR